MDLYDHCLRFHDGFFFNTNFALNHATVDVKMITILPLTSLFTEALITLLFYYNNDLIKSPFKGKTK